MSKKKKNTTINTYQQALLRGLKVPVNSESLNVIDEFIQIYHDLRESLGITDEDPLRPNQITEQFFEEGKDMASWMLMIKHLMLGYWYEHKLFYRISAEAMAQAQTMHPGCMHINSKKLFGALTAPAYIEFPDENGKQSFFAGVTDIPPIYDEQYQAIAKILKEHGEEPNRATRILVIIDTSENVIDKAIMTISLSDSIAEDFARLFSDDAATKSRKQLFLVFAYLCYASYARDSMNYTVFPVARNDAEVYDIRPIPDCDYPIDFANNTSWIRQGFARCLGFISHKSYVDVLSRFAAPEFPLDPERNNVISTKEFDRLKALAAKSWEDNKIVFQYSTETVNKVWGEGIDISPERRQDLFRYFPHRWIALNNTSTGRASLCGMVPMKCKGEVFDGVAIIAYSIVDNGLSLIPVNSENIHTLSLGEQAFTQLEEATVMVFHILEVLKAKTEKLLEKSKDESKPWTMRIYERKDAIKKVADIYTDTYYDFQLNEVTPKTIKRIPQKQALHMAGWTQRPHERRAHPHRYWVGHGEDRHMITHWLEPMQIHGDKKKPAVVHKMEPGKTKDD